LSETGATQTRLNQVFMVGPQDRFLSFTLSNLALDDATNGPDDAFEAALLNANTGADLLSPLALSHTDALLNLQAGGNNNGLLDSNVSTVDITITPVNDAPVAALLNVTLAEDSAIPLDLTINPVNDAPLAADVSVTVLEDSTVAINLVATDADNTVAELQFAIETATTQALQYKT
jgi:hypothetical protein